MPSVTGYSITMFARRNADATRRAMIVLTGPEGKLATLLFRDEGVPIPKIKHVDDKDFEFPMSAWLPMIDFLRNEKPINIQVHERELQLFGSNEEVGQRDG